MRKEQPSSRGTKESAVQEETISEKEAATQVKEGATRVEQKSSASAGTVLAIRNHESATQSARVLCGDGHAALATLIRMRQFWIHPCARASSCLMPLGAVQIASYTGSHPCFCRQSRGSPSPLPRHSLFSTRRPIVPRFWLSSSDNC